MTEYSFLGELSLLEETGIQMVELMSNGMVELLNWQGADKVKRSI